MPHYKAPNKRIIPRGSRGRFRSTTLEDFGVATCTDCKSFFTPDYSAARIDGFIDPMMLNLLREKCPNCLKKK